MFHRGDQFVKVAPIRPFSRPPRDRRVWYVQNGADSTRTRHHHGDAIANEDGLADIMSDEDSGRSRFRPQDIEEKLLHFGAGITV